MHSWLDLFKLRRQGRVTTIYRILNIDGTTFTNYTRTLTATAYEALRTTN